MCMTALMSTSLKVVSMAAVLCASLSRRAMVWRSRVIFTRSSRAASSAGDGARTCPPVCATGVGEAAARSIAAIMSPLVTRPSLPEPSTLPGSTPVSAAIRRTDGANGASGLLAAWPSAFGGAPTCGSSSAAPIGFVVEVFWSGRPVGATADFVEAGAPAPSLIWPSRAPTATVSPSLAAMSDSTPAAGAGTSIVTLSVSSSTNGSSTATASPGFLNHLPMVASVTDSPSVGTRISAITFCLSAQRFFEQLLQLRLVLRHLAHRGRGGSRTRGVARTAILGFDLVQHPFEIMLDEVPGAHVARLLLAPDDFGLLEARKFGHQCLGREGIQLLDAQDVDVVDAALLALLVDIVIDLAGTQDDTADLVVGLQFDLLVGQQL